MVQPFVTLKGGFAEENAPAAFAGESGPPISLRVPPSSSSLLVSSSEVDTGFFLRRRMRTRLVVRRCNQDEKADSPRKV